MTEDTDRARLARLIIRKRLDRTVPPPDLRPTDFIAAWLDGEIQLDELRERMGLTGVEIRRLRLAAAEAAAAELGRLAIEKEALAELGRSTDDMIEATRRRDED